MEIKAPKTTVQGLGVTGQCRKTPEDKLESNDLLKTYGKWQFKLWHVARVVSTCF